MNLREVRPSPATALLDATRRAGAATDLALRMRRYGRLSYERVEKFGELASLPASELRLWCLPTLRDIGVIDYADADGKITEVEERVGVAAPPLEQCSVLWEALRPKAAEACAIESADHAAYAPMAESDHRAALEAAGYPAELHERAFLSLEAVGLLRREKSKALGERIFYSPYVWGTEAVDIAAFMKNLPPNERELVASLSRQAAEHPGTPVERLPGDERLLRAARKTGMIDATRVMTTGQSERYFAFSPDLEKQLTLGATDATHERKQFVAHILNGHFHGLPRTGRIRDPVALVGALLRKGSVGPTTAAKTDYPLLEAAGIVRVDEMQSGLGKLVLVKEDVARDSLELLRRALGEGSARTTDPLDSLWLPGAFHSPERDRHSLQEVGEGAEAEVVQSTVEELRALTLRDRQEAIGRRLRAEVF